MTDSSQPPDSLHTGSSDQVSSNNFPSRLSAVAENPVYFSKRGSIQLGPGPSNQANDFHSMDPNSISGGHNGSLGNFSSLFPPTGRNDSILNPRFSFDASGQGNPTGSSFSGNSFSGGSSNGMGIPYQESFPYNGDLSKEYMYPNHGSSISTGSNYLQPYPNDRLHGSHSDNLVAGRRQSEQLEPFIPGGSSSGNNGSNQFLASQQSSNINQLPGTRSRQNSILFSRIRFPSIAQGVDTSDFEYMKRDSITNKMFDAPNDLYDSLQAQQQQGLQQQQQQQQQQQSGPGHARSSSNPFQSNVLPPMSAPLPPRMVSSSNIDHGGPHYSHHTHTHSGHLVHPIPMINQQPQNPILSNKPIRPVTNSNNNNRKISPRKKIEASPISSQSLTPSIASIPPTSPTKKQKLSHLTQHHQPQHQDQQQSVPIFKAEAMSTKNPVAQIHSTNGRPISNPSASNSVPGGTLIPANEAVHTEDGRPLIGATKIDQLMLVIQARKKGLTNDIQQAEDGTILEEISPQGVLTGSVLPNPAQLVGGVEKMTSRGSKQHECDICLKRFTQSTHLDVHRRSHTGEKPFQCQYCRKKFTQAGNLKTHERLHTGEKPYSCPICRKQFSRKGNLQAHELTHQNRRPYECKLDNCNKSFTQLGNLKAHQNRFHMETLNELTNKLAHYTTLGTLDNLPAGERELLDYFQSLYKNLNRGIRGRGKTGTNSEKTSPTENAAPLSSSQQQQNNTIVPSATPNSISTMQSATASGIPLSMGNGSGQMHSQSGF